MKIGATVMIFKDAVNEYGEIYGTNVDEFDLKFPIDEHHQDKLDILNPLMKELQEFKENDLNEYLETVYRCGCYKTSINNCKIDVYLYNEEDEDIRYDMYNNGELE